MTKQACLLALCVPAVALAAPAPAARLVTAEAVVKPLSGNLRQVAAGLVAVTGTPGMQAVVNERRGTVTFRVTSRPKKEALALLAAAVDAHKARETQAHAVASPEQYERLVVMARLQARGGAVAQVKEVGGLRKAAWQVTADVKAAIDRSVLQAPRVVPAGVFGRDAAR